MTDHKFLPAPAQVERKRRSIPIYAGLQLPMMSCLSTLSTRKTATEFVAEAVEALLFDYASRPEPEYDRWRKVLATYLVDGEEGLPEVQDAQDNAPTD